MKSWHRNTALRLLALAAVASALITDAHAQTAATAAQTATKNDDAVAVAAFEAIMPVLHHPRCMNCHSKGDYPRQGDDGHRHIMQVQRGPNGVGEGIVGCSSCHQERNTSGLHAPPGAPDWQLPSPRMPMIWEGLSDRQLCELFKDSSQNGGRDPQGIVEHMHTPLVLWGWHPGEGRAPVPMPQQKFLAKVQEWSSKGAACPAEKAISHH
jgi:hypothetical protein